MAEIFISLEEAATLEETTYEVFKKRVQRSLSYLTKTEKGLSGGRERVNVALSSLSSRAKKNYRFQLMVVMADEMLKEKEEPWYVNVDVSWYQENYKKNYYEAVELRNFLQEFINYDSEDRTLYANEFATKLGVSQRTLYRHERALREAAAWAYKFEQKDKCSYEYFQILALCRKPKEKGEFPSLSNEVRTVIENIWYDKKFASNDPTVEMLYTVLQKITADKDWKCPSYQTVVRYIHHLMVDLKEANAHYLLAKGVKEYRNKVMHKAARDLASLPVMGMVQGDGHTFDCWVSYTHPNGKVSAVKPVLVAWIDMRSRAVMGDVMCVHANARILKQSLIKMLHSEVGGVPQCILIDNGKDYTSKEMTGRDRKQRRADEENRLIALDAEAQGFYRSIGIEDDFRALPYSGWVKGQIERFFGTVCKQFTKWFDSYTGTLTGSKTAAKIEKDIPKLLKAGQLFTMEEFFGLWEQWKNDVYMKRIHSGLKAQREEYKTPLECFLYGENRYFKAAPPKSYSAMLMMKAEEVHVSQQGIRRFGNIYYAPELCDYQNQKVSIKYDTEDVTTLYVYDKDGKKICEAVSQELLQVAPRVPQKALEEHMKEQNRQLREDRERIEKRQKTLEERIQEQEAAAPVVGSFELTKGKKPAKAAVKKSNVVRLPVDKQYSEELKNRKPDSNESYFVNNAENALNKLRQLG